MDDFKNRFEKINEIFGNVSKNMKDMGGMLPAPGPFDAITIPPAPIQITEYNQYVFSLLLSVFTVNALSAGKKIMSNCRGGNTLEELENNMNIALDDKYTLNKIFMTDDSLALYVYSSGNCIVHTANEELYKKIFKDE